MSEIAFFVPCFNEAENITDTLNTIRFALEGREIICEILVIDDASSDDTGIKVNEFKNKYPDLNLKFFRNERNCGSGYNHKFGATMVSAKYYAIIPGDNDFPEAAIKSILDNLGIAEVLLPYPRPEDFRKRPLFRRLVSKTYTFLVHILSGHKLHYFHSPAVYLRSFVVGSTQRASGFGYYAELLCEALDKKLSHLEFAVPANYVGETETSAFRLKNVFSVAISLCRIMGRRFKKIFQKIYRVLFQNFGIMAIAFVVGGIYFLPNILIPVFQDRGGFGVYHPMSLEAPTLDEVAAYGSRLREVMDGHFSDGDAYLREYKNQPTMWGSDVMAVMLGAIPFVFGMKDPTPVYVFGDFFFPVLIFLAAYALFFIITRNKLWSIFGALIFSAFPNISVFRSFFSPAFYSAFSPERLFGVFERVFNPSLTRLFVPGFSLLFFILFLFTVLRALKSEKEKIISNILSASLAFGFLFYIYFYYWAFATVLMFILSVLLLFVGREKAFTAIKILFGGFIVSLPYWIKFLKLRNNPLYEELSARVGLEVNRAFRIESMDAYILAIVLSIVLIWLGRKRGEIITGIFLGAALLSYIVVLNIQIVIGFNIQPDHWGSRVNVYILSMGTIITIFWLFDFLSKKFKNSRPILSAPIIYALLLFFLSMALVVQIRNSSFAANDYRISKDLLAAYKWIDRNTPKDSVFLSPSSKTTFYLPFFTHANVYVPPACYSLLPRDQIIDRFLESYAYFGVPESFLKKSL